MSKELTVQERAIAALGLASLKQDLTKLAESSKNLVEIKNQDGYQQIHAARMVLKNQRVDIGKRGKEARDDANAFAKAVIAEEKKLISIISPEEDRLQALQKDHDDREERERQAKIDAEIERVENIQARIEGMRAGVDAIINSPRQSAEIAEYLESYRIQTIGKSFEEFRQQAQDTFDAGLSRLTEHHRATVEREAEAAKIAAEREELAKLRAAEEERQAKEKAEREQAEAEARKKREAEEKAERDRLEKQRSEQAAAQKKIDDEQKRLADEREAIESAKRQAEQKRIAEEKADEERKANAAAAAKKAKYPGDDAIIDALSKHFRVDRKIVVTWLSQVRIAA